MVGLGASERTAQVVAASLIDADRRGVQTHGLVRLPSYCAETRAGRVVVDADPCVEREHGPTAMVDGRGAFGAVTGTVSMDEAIARAETYGVGFVTARGCNHFGAAAFYSLRAVARGMVGDRRNEHAGRDGPLGRGGSTARQQSAVDRCPHARGQGPPSSSIWPSRQCLAGESSSAELNDEPIPDTWALDSEGLPTTDPAAAWQGLSSRRVATRGPAWRWPSRC